VSAPVRCSIADWETRLRPLLDRMAEAIVAAGRELVDAKADLPRGEWLRLLEVLELHPRTAQRLMAIAQHPTLADATHWVALPTSWRTVAELARVPEGRLEAAIWSGRVHPGMTRAAALELVAEANLEELVALGDELMALMTPEDKRLLVLADRFEGRKGRNLKAQAARRVERWIEEIEERCPSHKLAERALFASLNETLARLGRARVTA
jgi:hypothetical protein